MKALIVFLLFFHVNAGAQTLQEMRIYLQQGENSEGTSLKMIAESRKAYVQEKDAVYLAFEGVGNFFMAKHAMNPFKKMEYFKKGKICMESAVRESPDHIEIRLMRYMSQEKAPSILGYNKNMEEDRNFIIRNYRQSNDPELVKFIRKTFKL